MAWAGVRGDVSGPGAWSPDGRFVVVQGQQSPQLVEVATGDVVRDFPVSTVHWVADDRLLYLDEEGGDAVLIDGGAVELARMPLPAEMLGLEVFIAPA